MNDDGHDERKQWNVDKTPAQLKSITYHSPMNDKKKHIKFKMLFESKANIDIHLWIQ